MPKYCNVVKFGNGSTAIICGPTKFKLCEYGCGRFQEVLCDFKLPGGGTCNKGTCRQCCSHVGQNKDYCKDHAAEVCQLEMQL